MTKLFAKSAANALCGINGNAGFRFANGGAADFHTHTAVFALCCVADERRAGLLNNKRTGTAGDNNGKLFTLGLFANNLFEFFNVERIDNANMLDAHCIAELENIKACCGFAVDVVAVCGVVLVTGHAGDGVIGNDNRADGAIVCHVEKSGETAVAEGGVAENCNCFLCLLMTACLFHAVCHSDGCTHAYACVNSAERRQRTESVAADIGTYREFELAEYVIKAPVRAAGAE